MNADELLRHYERVADAPDAVPRLRAFCLRLALQGKLTGNGDETWAEARILDCLEPQDDGKKIHQGWSPQCEAAPSPSEEVWGVLRTTAIQDGYFLQAENKRLPDSLVPKPHLEVRSDDILLTCAGPRARCGIVCRVSTTRPRLMISGKMYRFRANKARILPEFLALLLRGEESQGAINLMKTGSSESGLNLTQERFSSLRLRFGTLAEQKEVVAKVDELMALCDRLEAQWAKREAARDRLTAAILARLNATDPETFTDESRFVLGPFPAITARPDQIKNLRQTIINLAVQGKLCHQVPGDAPASSLLSRIQERRGALSGRKRRLAQKTEAAATAEADSGVPAGWAWTCLGDLALDIRFGTSKKCAHEPIGTPVLRIPNVSGGHVSLADLKFGPLTETEKADLALQVGDLLIIRSNGSLDIVGRAAEVTPAAVGMSFAGYLVRVRLAATEVLPRYIWLCMHSSEVRDQVEKPIRSAVGLKNVNSSEIAALRFRLPPLEEQKRIVARVSELTSLCDRLALSLALEQTRRDQLLDALLRQTLEPVEVMEAVP